MKVKCPNCKKENLYSEENSFRPFCSKRCKLIDLGEWAEESYSIAAEKQEWSEEDLSEFSLDTEFNEDTHWN